VICENGVLVGEAARFSREPQLVTGDIDLERIAQDRMRQNSFSQAVNAHHDHRCFAGRLGRKAQSG